MAEFFGIRETANPKGKEIRSLSGQTVAGPGDDACLYCVYNVNRERFVSTEVEGADFSPILLESRMATLKPGSGTAFWLTPYRGLSSTSFRFPIDLVTLNRSHVVLEVLESYPLTRGSESGPAAASALALPSNSIASIGIRPGDQLILGTPEEMKSHLKRLESQKSSSPMIPISAHQQGPEGEIAGESDAVGDSGIRALGDRLYWEGQEPGPTPGANGQSKVQAVEEPSSADPDRAAIAEQLGWNKPNPTPKPKKSWWQPWKSKSNEPEDPRHAMRNRLPGLVAYFFTGGIPSAHGVRNISASGVYVFTEERWYLGTVVRLTLTDHREQTSERSITVNAEVIRWGNDGVGLQFLVRREKDPSVPADGTPGSTTREQVEEFLRRYRGEPEANQG